MSYVQYWSVGSSSDIELSLSRAEICRSLIADWLPTLPFAVSPSILGWPQYILTVEAGATPYLVLARMAGWSDRQWKGVLSWMLGIAGARRVLDEEQYMWTAHLSAFYPDRRQPVLIPPWPPCFPRPRSAVEISNDPANGSRLRPDYITARMFSSGITEFALVEAKGTSGSLTNTQRCPSDWAKQVRNAIVTANGLSVAIPRHLVVATRCNPNGIREKSRRLQVRAWNEQRTTPVESQDLLIEVASAHYEGICRNLGLWNNLRALQIASWARRTGDEWFSYMLHDSVTEAKIELQEQGDWHPSGDSDAHFKMQTDLGIISIQLKSYAILLMRSITSMTQPNKLVETIQRYGIELIGWYSETTTRYQDAANVAVDRSGFLINTEHLQDVETLYS